MALVTIQTRRGNYGEFDKSKLLPGEPAAVLADDPDTPSGKAFYVAFAAGDVRRLVSIEDIEIMVQDGKFKGEKGDTGTGVTGVDIDKNGHLQVTLSDGSTIDAGLIDDALALIDEAVQSAENAAQSASNAEKSAQQAATNAQATAEDRTAVQVDKQAVNATAAQMEEARKNTEENQQKALASEHAARDYVKEAQEQAETAGSFAASASDDADTAAQKAAEASQSAADAAESAKALETYDNLSKSYAVGDTGTRDGEETDNSKYYSEQSRKESERAEVEANKAARYAQVIAPGFYVDPETMMLYMKSGVKVDFQVVDDNVLCWALTA